MMCSGGTLYIWQDFLKAKSWKSLNTILAAFQLMNEMSAIAANNFIANLVLMFLMFVDLDQLRCT